MRGSALGCLKQLVQVRGLIVSLERSDAQAFVRADMRPRTSSGRAAYETTAEYYWQYSGTRTPYAAIGRVVLA